MILPTHSSASSLTLLQDCLRSCQEQIEALLESSLRKAQQYTVSTETKHAEEEVDLSSTPTDVRDINIWLSNRDGEVEEK